MLFLFTQIFQKGTFWNFGTLISQYLFRYRYDVLNEYKSAYWPSCLLTNHSGAPHTSGREAGGGFPYSGTSKLFTCKIHLLLGRVFGR